MPEEIPTRYDPHEVEARLYPEWEGRGDFTADAAAVLAGVRPPFTVMIPPPNVTGALHMGHALNNTLQDVLCRWRRMAGDEVLWLPGIDHAGIATQAVVERKLFQERGLKRIEMGREAFLAEVWAWKEQYGGTILRQLRRLGCGCDWTRTKFTMDGDLSRAVRLAFVRLFEQGLVHRAARLVNWDCVLETAVGDDEIEYEDRKGKLWHVRYPRTDGKGAVVVATTRPETMLGDTGIAVHPDDDRWRDAVGKTVRLPLLDREIPVVADGTVERGFGTGAVKVTPGHDPADYERGKRHGLPVLLVMDAKGRITREGGPYEGLSREQARDRIVADLEARGLLEKVEDHPHRVAVSERSKSPIEPMISEQWFVDMKGLAAPAIAAVKDGTLSFRPERWRKVYLDWLENVRDWCISRQLWWGHRIPVWYDEDGAPVALLEDPVPGALHPGTGKPLVRRDEDVLDTWASSWLWPLSTLGWPDREAEDFRAFYPTSFLSTAREIIYLWVARMVMAGYAFDGRCPFSTVYIHATILDGKGRRMSKSAGNGIDPVDMIDRYGADAVRFTLVDLTTEGQDVRLAENRFEVGRNFMNKLWNAGRFVAGAGGDRPVPRPADGDLAVEDRWILHRLARTVAEATGHLRGHRFHEYARCLYGFAWNELCDWYLEIVKPRLEGEAGPAVLWTLREAYGTVLRLLHPAAPFLTEEMARRLGLLPAGTETLARAPWPGAAEVPGGEEAAAEIALLQAVVTAVRTLRGEYRVPDAAGVDADVRVGGAATEVLLRHEAAVRRLGKIEALAVGPEVARRPLSAVAHLPEGVEVYVPLEGRIDLVAERERLAREIGKAEDQMAAADRKLANADFVARARPEVVEGERARRAEIAALAARLRESLEALA